MATRFLAKLHGVDESTAIANDATGLLILPNLPSAAGIAIDKVDFKVKFNSNGAIVTLLDTGGLTGVPTTAGLVAVNSTVTSATPGSVRAVVGSITAPAALTTGTLTGVRGVITLPLLGTVATGCFLFGAQGKFIGSTGVIDAGSGHVAGLYAQMDLLGTTTTSGHVAPLIVSGQNLGTAGANVDLIYVESGRGAGTNANALIHALVDATFFIDVGGISEARPAYVTATSPGGAASLWLRIKAGGTAYKIALLADA